MRLLLALWLALCAAAVPAYAQGVDDPAEAAASAAALVAARGQERILAFTSDVVIAKNGDYDVTETIRLIANGDQIKRGILRDFPTSYTNRFGQRTRVGFTVLSVDRDGRPEKFEQTDSGNGASVRIGDADVLLPPGEHVYVIHYRTTRQIAYQDGFDEIYWNVTGNGWTFPIEMAEARITLPTAARFGDRAVYTGPDGSTAKNAEVIEERPGFIHFRTTAPLDSYSGLTVGAAFPKGVLDAPGQARKLRWWIEDWGPLAAGLLAVAGLLAYFFYAWLRAGKGPRAGTVVPIFAPPEDLSAAACRYISKMKSDNRAFTAAIVDLAVRGHIGITKVGGGWFSSGTTTLDRKEGGRPTPAPELAMRDAMLPGVGSKIELKQDNHGTLQSARASLVNGLEEAYSGRYFRKNSGWAVAGMLAIAAAIALVSVITLFIRAGPGTPAAMWNMPFFTVLALAAAWFCQRLTEGKGLVMIFAWAGLCVAVIIAFFTGFITLGLALDGGDWPVLLPLVVLPLGFTAFTWMYAPTVEGRAVMDRIAGFHHYLGITEEERLDTMHPPEKTPELFERYLPYAIALDVENRWADKFATVLAAAAAAGAAVHTAAWYSGDDSFWRNPSSFAHSMGSTLNSTISSASSSPSSSSGGSSGGGSSGGGGGGGGGSGW